MTSEDVSIFHTRASDSRGRTPDDARQLTRLLESAIDELADAFVIVDRDDEFVVWNARMTELSGYTDDEIARMSPIDFFDDSDANRIAEAVRSAGTTGRSIVQADLVRKDGRTVPMEFTGSRLERDGEYIGTVGIGRNLEHVDRYKQRYYGLLDRITDGFYALDADWRFTYLNKRAREMFPEPNGTLVGTSIWEAYPAVRDSSIGAHLREAVEQQTPVTFERYFEPQDRWYRIRAYPDVDGLSVLFSDITEEKARITRLEEFEAMINHVPEAVFVVDPDRRIEFARYGGDAFSHDASLFEGEPVSVARQFMDDATYDRFARAIDAAFEGEIVTTRPMCEATIEGREYVFEFQFAPLERNDEVTRVIGTGHDETDLVAKQRELERQNERLERFAGVVSHDLRNPLNVAQGCVEMAREGEDVDGLEIAARALGRMEALIGDLLFLAREGQDIDTVEPVALADLVDECWAGMETDGATLATTTTRTVHADRGRLRQLLENLLRNSIEHGGEAVNVTVGDLSDADGFYVADDGPGIPPAERERVFEAGHSVDGSGTGLGLRIVQQVAEAHGWEVRATESEDGGARFEVRTADGVAGD
jgi:PAS domain S-box-containing protein